MVCYYCGRDRSGHDADPRRHLWLTRDLVLGRVRSFRTPAAARFVARRVAADMAAKANGMAA